jgi:hypothetical protein
MFVETSGNIRSQIGQSLNAIRIKTDMGDVLGVADHLTLLVALCGPKLSPEERERFAVPEMDGGKDKNGEKQRKLFSQCMSILSELLIVLSEKQLYAYKDVPIGDASELAALLEAGVLPVPNE